MRATDGIFSWQEIVQENVDKERKAKAFQDALSKASSVPEDFDAAVDLAFATWTAAGEEKWQTMQVSSEAEEDDGSVAIDFGITLASLIADQSRDGLVAVLFPGEEVAELCRKEWEPLPDGVEIMPIPEEGSSPVDAFEKASVFVIVSPEEMDVAGLAEIQRLLGVEDTRRALVVNPLLPDEAYGQIGLESVPCRTFHMQRVAPSAYSMEDLNEAVVMRVWPQTFTIWEDNPTDPAAVDGYFLLGLRDNVPSRTDVMTLLTSSSKKFKQRGFGRR